MQNRFSAQLRVLALCLCGVLLMSACNAPGASQAATDDLQISLIPAPEANAGKTLTVVLADANGDPITDASVSLEGNMNHAGMVPVITGSVTDEADGSVDGHYQVPFAFTMFGDWIITVKITQADGTSVSRNLDVQVSEGSVTGAEVVGPEGSGAGHDAHETGEGAAADSSGGIMVVDARVREAPLAGGTAAVYFTLHNHTDADVTLIGGETAAAAAVEVHETVDDNGVMRMQPLDGAVAASHGSVELMPGGIHLMLLELAEPLEAGQSIELTLHFDGADDLTLSVPVVTVEESMQGMDEGEHNH